MKTFLIWLSLFGFSVASVQAQIYTGTFERSQGDVISRIAVADGYLIWTDFSIERKEFIRTWGGKYSTSAQGQLAVEVEFDSKDPLTVASMQTYSFKEKKKVWSINGDNYTLVDGSQKGPMAGNWRITGRNGADGTLGQMQPGPRKTIKLLTGNTFQWAAINTATREAFLPEPPAIFASSRV